MNKKKKEIKKAGDVKSSVEYENIIGKQIDRVAYSRDTDICRYARAVESLVLLLPKDLKDKADVKRKALGLAPGEYGNMSQEKMILYDNLWVYINGLLEKANLVFRSG